MAALSADRSCAAGVVVGLGPSEAPPGLRLPRASSGAFAAPSGVAGTDALAERAVAEAAAVVAATGEAAAGVGAAAAGSGSVRGFGAQSLLGSGEVAGASSAEPGPESGLR